MQTGLKLVCNDSFLLGILTHTGFFTAPILLLAYSSAKTSSLSGMARIAPFRVVTM